MTALHPRSITIDDWRKLAAVGDFDSNYLHLRNGEPAMGQLRLGSGSLTVPLPASEMGRKRTSADGPERRLQTRVTRQSRGKKCGKRLEILIVNQVISSV